MFLFALLFTLSYAASSGATACDALGLCSELSSGASYDAATNTTKCPLGMHLVAPPIRSDDYFVGTADHGLNQTDFYTPNEFMDIHIRVLHPQKKFLGILIYAVQNDGVIGAQGCVDGCDGASEVKVGEWDVVGTRFQTGCGGKSLTHTAAKLKNYHHVFRWRAPAAGSGDVIFRVIVKAGSTNGGFFYWPMTSGDLMLYEGSTELKTEWFSGDISKTCTKICRGLNKVCDRDISLNGDLSFYDTMKHSQSCQQPLLSTCARSPPTRDAQGFCWLENRASGTCDSGASNVNLCDAREAAGGDERLCPCLPAPTSMPTTSPTSGPTQTKQSTTTIENSQQSTTSTVVGGNTQSTASSTTIGTSSSGATTIGSSTTSSGATTDGTSTTSAGATTNSTSTISNGMSNTEPIEDSDGLGIAGIPTINQGSRGNTVPSNEEASKFSSILPLIAGGVCIVGSIIFASVYWYCRKIETPKMISDAENQISMTKPCIPPPPPTLKRSPPPIPKRVPPTPPFLNNGPEGVRSPDTRTLHSLWNRA